MFLLPAFTNNITKNKIIGFIILSSILFILGLIFGYFILVPFSISFFESISLPLLDSISLNFTLENYLVYLIWALIITSTLYQLPVLVLFLVQVGFADIEWLKTNRSYIYIAFFILSALLTPPDPLSQILIALPLIFLYEFSILLIKVIKK